MVILLKYERGLNVVGEAIFFILGWFLGCIQGIATDVSVAMENKSKEKNESKKYEELKKYESKEKS